MGFVKGWFYHGTKVSMWENIREDGRKSVSYSIGKSYKDKATGEYKESNSFFSDDLSNLIHCLLAAKNDRIKEIFPKEGQNTPEKQPSEQAQNVAEQFNGDNIPF